MSLWQCVVLDISFATAGVDLELNSTLGNPTSVFQLIPDFGLVSTFCIALSNDIQKRLTASMQELSLAHSLSLYPILSRTKRRAFSAEDLHGQRCWHNILSGLGIYNLETLAF